MELGQLLDIPSLSTVQRLVPRTNADASPASYSGNYGLGDFPMHTDLAHWAKPPRFLLLRCISGATDVSTRLLDGHLLCRTVGIDRVSRVLLRPRRPIDKSRLLLRLLDENASGSSRLRWDELFLTPANGFARTAVADMLMAMQSSPRTEVFLADAGDTLVIDNWRMLHGRSPVASGARGRVIERAYLGALS
jgi:L-asparagine oxygenase